MSEAILEKPLADLRDVKIDQTLSVRERCAEYRRQLNNNPHNYLCGEYTIHETFAAEGPSFTDCVVRIFA